MRLPSGNIDGDGTGGGRDSKRRWLWLAISAVGAVVSFFMNLYIDSVKRVVEWTWSRFAVQWVLFSLIVFACSYATWVVRGWTIARRMERRQIVEHTFPIRTEEFEDDVPIEEAIVGRRLRYLERVTESPVLVVCLHGLGLDANDFRRFMAAAREHTAAITMFGFNTDEAKDARYRPIGLTTHAHLLSRLINELQQQYPRKKLVLIGFSLGADMQLRLAELWRERPDKQPNVAAMLLLDPNINHSTMVVSGGVAKLDGADPLTALKRIAEIPNTLVEFQNICEYLHKITNKDLDQVKRFASDMVAYWEPEGHFELFLQRIGDLQRVSPRVKVLFSANYEDHFGDIIGIARQRRINREIFAVEEVDHFDLLEENLLRREVAALTGVRYPRLKLGA
ncbi:MAG TPA: alpha/beta fold hydrolase [Candidatus Limnocylindrales bacterium]